MYREPLDHCAGCGNLTRNATAEHGPLCPFCAALAQGLERLGTLAHNAEAVAQAAEASDLYAVLTGAAQRIPPRVAGIGLWAEGGPEGGMPLW